MEDIVKESLLFDFYGNLLTEKMRRGTELYNEDNLSLAEIAEQEGISRAAVHDRLQKAQQKLEAYESKLGLVDRFVENGRAAMRIAALTEEIGRERTDDPDLNGKLREIRELVAVISG